MQKRTAETNTPVIVSINISTQKGTGKTPCAAVKVNELGIETDAHGGKWHRQISLLAKESIERMNEAGHAFAPGDFAENITTAHIDLPSLPVGARLTTGEVELEITQIGKKCHGSGCSIYREAGSCIMPHEGVFAKVIKPGTLQKGMTIQIKE